MGFWFGSYQGQGLYPYGMMNGYNGYGGNNGYGGYYGSGGNGGYGWMFNMMNGYTGYGYGMMRGLGFGFSFMGILGVVLGMIVIVSALMLHSRPEKHTTWGILIIIFSALSTFGIMTGLSVGLILGIIGGVLAVTWRPKA